VDTTSLHTLRDCKFYGASRGAVRSRDRRDREREFSCGGFMQRVIDFYSIVYPTNNFI